MHYNLDVLVKHYDIMYCFHKYFFLWHLVLSNISKELDILYIVDTLYTTIFTGVSQDFQNSTPFSSLLFCYAEFMTLFLILLGLKQNPGCRSNSGVKYSCDNPLTSTQDQKHKMQSAPSSVFCNFFTEQIPISMYNVSWKVRCMHQ